MGRPSAIPTEEKLRLVLSVISGEMTIAQAARHGKVSEQSVSRWKQQFLSGAKDGLAVGGRSGINDPRERELLSEIESFGPPSARRTSSCGYGNARLRGAWAL